MSARDSRLYGRKGKIVLERVYPCGCRATGNPDLPNYCPDHARTHEQDVFAACQCYYDDQVTGLIILCPLHAAALALLEALKSVTRLLGGMALNEHEHKVVDKARSAIRQAKGETNG